LPDIPQIHDLSLRDHLVAQHAPRPGWRQPRRSRGRDDQWAEGSRRDHATQSRLSRRARPLNRYLRHEAGLGGRVRELAILTTARELDSQFEWAAHEPEALGEGISREIIEIIKHRKDTSGLDEADAIVIELGREIFGARKVTSATFARALRQFGRRTLVDLVALMGNYAGTAALLTAFDMQLDPSQPPPLPQP
jgi:alkylhydroperoxidase family enzyme